MERNDLSELHYITSISTLPSIAENGILSHVRAKALPHTDLSMQAIQDRRDKRSVPDTRRAKPRKLHEYANLYFTARNPMLYVRQDQHEYICVLRVSTAVLDLEGVVIADGNASSDYTRFDPAPEGLASVDRDRTYARFWTSQDYYEYLERKRRKCAEVLVPDRVPPELIVGGYISCPASRATCSELGLPWDFTSKPDIFFQ